MQRIEVTNFSAPKSAILRLLGGHEVRDPAYVNAELFLCTRSQSGNVKYSYVVH